MDRGLENLRGASGCTKWNFARGAFQKKKAGFYIRKGTTEGFSRARLCVGIRWLVGGAVIEREGSKTGKVGAVHGAGVDHPKKGGGDLGRGRGGCQWGRRYTQKKLICREGSYGHQANHRYRAAEPLTRITGKNSVLLKKKQARDLKKATNEKGETPQSAWITFGVLLRNGNYGSLPAQWAIVGGGDRHERERKWSIQVLKGSKEGKATEAMLSMSPLFGTRHRTRTAKEKTQRRGECLR